MKRLISDTKKHVVILVLICAVTSLLLLILGNFIDLHPDAFFDLNRSIVVVYVLMFILTQLFSLFLSKTSIGNKLNTHLNTSKSDEPIKSIAITFMVITLINSLMMILGIDTPKVGVFAYVHMMTRFFIVFSIIFLIMWKDFITWIKKLSLNNGLKRFQKYSQKNPLSAISILFTIFTVVYCTIIIIFQGLINPIGGVNFYITLLAVLSIITLVTVVLNITNKKTKSQ